MRLSGWCVAVALAMGSALASAPVSAQDKEAPLPLKRVRLYETGVGYFERTGATGTVGQGQVALPVPAGHLDDALKTLVVLTKDADVSIDGVEFSSSVSRQMGLALAGLPEEEGKISFNHLLDSLKGAPIELTTDKGKFSGRLVDVEAPPKDGHRLCKEKDGEQVCEKSFHRTLMLLSDKTAIRRFKSTDVTSVKPTDPAWKSRLGSALDALSQRGAQTSRKLRVLAKAGGKPVTLGYIAETPVWRSTYRLVLAKDNKSKDALQGWALLHNDTDEDWKKVKVDLVNGRPDSFLYPLAAPRYARRELVTPQRDLHTVPQLLDKTVDNMWDRERRYRPRHRPRLRRYHRSRRRLAERRLGLWLRPRPASHATLQESSLLVGGKPRRSGVQAAGVEAGALCSSYSLEASHRSAGPRLRPVAVSSVRNYSR